MSKKSVWIINQYITTPEINGDTHRHYNIAKYLKEQDYDITLITSSYSHIPNREYKFKGYFKILNTDIRTLMIKGSKYKSSQGLMRVLSWFVFMFLLLFIPFKKIPKPDVIIVSSNSLLPILNVIFYFKRKFKGVKFILEIRDIWPLTLIELGGFSKRNPLIMFLAWVERIGYKNADHIISLLKDTDTHIKSILKKKSFNYTWISNGYKVESDHYYKQLPNQLLSKISTNKFIVGYAGSLGKANNMKYVIESVKKLKKQNVVLCLLGEGNEKEELEIISKGADNIFFFGAIPKNQVHSFLKKCDVLFLSVRNLELYRFGISMNKTFDYMYAKKPIILAAPVKNSVIELSNVGIVVATESSKEIYNGILKIKELDNQKRDLMGEKGKKYLLNHLTYKKLTQKFITVIESA